MLLTSTTTVFFSPSFFKIPTDFGVMKTLLNQFGSKLQLCNFLPVRTFYWGKWLNIPQKPGKKQRGTVPPPSPGGPLLCFFSTLLPAVFCTAAAVSGEPLDSESDADRPFTCYLLCVDCVWFPALPSESCSLSPKLSHISLWLIIYNGDHLW